MSEHATRPPSAVFIEGTQPRAVEHDRGKLVPGTGVLSPPAVALFGGVAALYAVVAVGFYVLLTLISWRPLVLGASLLFVPFCAYLFGVELQERKRRIRKFASDVSTAYPVAFSALARREPR